MKSNRSFYTLAKQWRGSYGQVPRASERRLQLTETVINKIINDTINSIRNRLTARQVSLSPPKWEYLLNGTQSQQGIGSLLGVQQTGTQQTGIDIFTQTGWDMLENAVRELLKNHFERELRVIGLQGFVSPPDISSLVNDAIQRIQEGIQKFKEQQRIGRFKEWLGRIVSHLSTVAGNLSPSQAATVARYRLLDFELPDRAKELFNALVKEREERFKEEISDEVSKAAATLETNARAEVNNAIENLVQRFQRVWQDAVTRYQQQSGSVQSPANIQLPVGAQWQLQHQQQQQLQAIREQIEKGLLTGLQREFQNWVSQVVPSLSKNISDYASQVSKGIEKSAVEVVKELINIYKQAVTSSVPEATLEDALYQALEGGGRQTTTTPSPGAMDANSVVNSLLDSLEKLTRALQTRNRNDLVNAVSEVMQAVSPNSPFVAGLSNFPQVANQISPWLDSIRQTPVDVDNDASLKAFLNLLVNTLNVLSAGGLQLNPTTAGRLNKVINDIRRHLQPTGGAPTVYKSIKWRVENPWQQLARVKWGGQKAPKEITKLMLWLPQLSEKERAFIMPYLYRYWLAIDKEEKKERLEELKRAARKLGITL